jgi:putative SOS response-associated peptidase YedK
MCGRITQKGDELPGLVTVSLIEERFPPRWNGAPSQDFWVIRRNPDTGEYRRDRLRWGFRTQWMRDAGSGGQINARAERIATAPMFRQSYEKRRCLIPVDNFFEWKAIRGAKAKQPYAVAMRDGSPYAVAGLWTSYREGEEVLRSFGIITCPANTLIAEIHHRMPVIISPENYDRWLSPIEPDPHDLLAPYPSETMVIWPISTRVNTPRNDSEDILERVEPFPESPRSERSAT